MDDICKEVNLKPESIDVIKIDVKGFELNVLRGVLKNSSSLLIVEITDKKKERKIKEFLNKLDFINEKVLDSRNFIFVKNKINQ